MILYHGSFLEIAKPDLVHSRFNVDFGRGFYVTPLYEKPNQQICFRTEKALSLLHFEGSETL